VRGGGRLKLHSLQALRALAALLIVAVHVSTPHGIEARYIPGPHITGHWLAIPGAAGVDLFFVISGTIMTITMWRRFAAPRASREFLYRRFTRIYPLYWVVTSLVLVVFVVRHGAVNSHDSHPPQVLQSFLILPQPGDPLVAVGWTLVYEIYFYLVFAFALLFSRRRFPWIIGAWTVVTVVIHIAVAGRPGNSYLGVASNLMNLEFVFGIVVGTLVMRRHLVAPRTLLVGAGIAAVPLLAYSASTGDPAFPSDWFRVFAIGLTFAVVVYAAIGAELGSKVRVPRLLERLGDASYSLYLWHVPILSIVGLALAEVLPSSLFTHVLALVAVFGIMIAAALWLYEILERPLLRVFHTRIFSAFVGDGPPKAAGPRPRTAD
jgi:exopolysaccharide production protein ExoZ